MNLSWTIDESAGDGQRVSLSGSITESADLQRLGPLAGADTLVLDLSGIEHINSCGVREWISFVSALTREGASFELVRCSPAVVRQLNMVSDFAGGGRVRSVMLPYYCAACGHEERTVLELDAGRDASGEIADAIPCPTCDETAEFDDLPASYTAFAHDHGVAVRSHDVG